MYEETAYPIREENGASWRPFWWYNANGDGRPSPLALCHPILSFSNLIAVYEESDYPIREENGASWRPFWWYNGTASGWPTGKNDTLGGNEQTIEFKG